MQAQRCLDFHNLLSVFCWFFSSLVWLASSNCAWPFMRRLRVTDCHCFFCQTLFLLLLPAASYTPPTMIHCLHFPFAQPLAQPFSTLNTNLSLNINKFSNNTCRFVFTIIITIMGRKKLFEWATCPCVNQTSSSPTAQTQESRQIWNLLFFLQEI